MKEKEDLPRFSQEKTLNYSKVDLFNIVADVEKYPEFIPWCYKSKIISNEGSVLIVELVIKFNFFKERYTSKVTLNRYDSIDVELVKGPFEYMKNQWLFNGDNENTNVSFVIDFKFNSIILEKTIGFVFEKAYSKILESFEKRASELN